MTNKSASVKVRITPGLKGRLERLALEDSRTVSDYVRLLLEHHVKSVGCFDELAAVEQVAPSSRFEKYQPGDIVTVRFDGNEFGKVVE